MRALRIRVLRRLGVMFPKFRLWYFHKTGRYLWGVSLFVDEVTPLFVEPETRKWLADTEEIGQMINSAMRRSR